MRTASSLIILFALWGGASGQEAGPAPVEKPHEGKRRLDDNSETPDKITEGEKKQISELLKKTAEKVRGVNGITSKVEWSTYESFGEGEDSVKGTSVVAVQDGKSSRALFKSPERMVAYDGKQVTVADVKEKKADRYQDPASFPGVAWRVGAPLFLKEEIEKEFEIRLIGYVDHEKQTGGATGKDPGGKERPGPKMAEGISPIPPSDMIQPSVRRVDQPKSEDRYFSLLLTPKTAGMRKAWSRVEVIMDRETGMIGMMTLIGGREPRQAIRFTDIRKQEKVDGSDFVVDLTDYTITSK